MLEGLNHWYRRRINRAALRQWARAADVADALPVEDLQRLRSDARRARAAAEEILHLTEARLALPVSGSAAIRKPVLADWAWRPALWSGPLFPAGLAAPASRTPFGSELTLFHDCPLSEIVLRQIPNHRPEDLAPYGLSIEVFAFSGSFLSLVLDLPEALQGGLSREHVIRLESVVETEMPLEVFARLNVRHGPNTEQIVREFDLRRTDVAVEFDLAYTEMNEKRVERMWVDIILDSPAYNRVHLRDITLSRRPRAAI
ncbi:MAG: hypothetical protein JJU40_13980 [Rhodobacteraceae bacterium]|nr:hypothetical protein [Paracoccaceae bacterium]